MAAEIIFLRREKVVLDTSIYISHLVRGFHSEAILDLVRSSVVFLHSIVFEELLAGVRTEREIRELHRFKKNFTKAGRLVTPNDGDWEETGLLVNQLIRKGRMPSLQAVGLTHDILLALSARRLGIRVITENRKDFEKIRSLKDFKLTLWSS